MQVNNVVIVGGGTSGWMTCAALLKLCPWVNVVLVESANSKPVGVGESTLGHFNKYLRALDLQDSDWMPYCNATYKNSIQFTDFADIGKTFQYPFGEYNFHQGNINGIEDWFDLKKKYPEEFTNDDEGISFAKYWNTVNTELALKNKESDAFGDFNPDSDRAYHLDAEKFGEWLRINICEPWSEVDRFTHVIGDVRGMVKDVKRGGSPAASNREIKQLAVRLSGDKKTVGVQGDLFIDCTGFKAALIEGIHNINFKPFKDILANDKAFFARVPYNNQEEREKLMHNVTDCTAAENGWLWNIPLWNRIGVGYCWSSRFALETETRAEFERYIEEEFGADLDKVEIKLIDIKHGYREKAWELNCVAIGLSYGFVEPLESTGLLTTHENVLRLVDILNRRKGYITNIERQWFNYNVQREVIGFSKFVAMHYALSTRTDNPYWRWCTQRNDYMFDEFDGNIKVNDNFERMGSVLDLVEPLSSQMNGMNYVAAGMGLQLGNRIKLDTQLPFDMDGSLDQVKEDRKQWFAEVEKYVEGCPSHYQYLLDNVYGGVDDVQLP